MPKEPNTAQHAQEAEETGNNFSVGGMHGLSYQDYINTTYELRDSNDGLYIPLVGSKTYFDKMNSSDWEEDSAEGQSNGDAKLKCFMAMMTVSDLTAIYMPRQSFAAMRWSIDQEFARIDKYYSDFKAKPAQELKDIAVHNGIGNSPQLDKAIYDLQNGNIEYSKGDSYAEYYMKNTDQLIIHDGKVVETEAEKLALQKELKMSFAGSSEEALNTGFKAAQVISEKTGLTGTFDQASNSSPPILGMTPAPEPEKTSELKMTPMPPPAPSI